MDKLKRGAALIGSVGIAAGAIALSAGSASASSFSSASPAKPAAAVSVRPNVIGYPDCGEVFTVTGTVVNIRSSWGTGAPIVGEAHRGDTIVVQYQTSYTYSGYYWDFGYDENNNTTGYIATAYLHNTGEPAYCTVLS